MGSGATIARKIYTPMVFPVRPCTYTKRRPHRCTFIPFTDGNKSENEIMIPCHYFECRKREFHSNTKTTIIYSHGNSADLGCMYDFVTLLHLNLPVNVLHYEYYGYGLTQNEGNPSETNTYRSIEAAYDWLLKTKCCEPEDIILMGTSLGCAPTIDLAAKVCGEGGRQFGGIILESPFTTTVKVVLNSFPETVLKPIDMFRNIEKIGKVRCPVLLMHGTRDNVVPYSHAVDLWSKVKEKYRYKFLSPESEHNFTIDALGARQFVKEIYDFLNYCKGEREMISRRLLSMD